MTFDDRIRIIALWLRNDVLPHYSPPSGIDKDTMRKQLQLICEDINSFIAADVNEGALEHQLTKIHKQIRILR